MTQARDKTAAELAALCVRAGLPKPERERLVCEGRKWRWDLYWPAGPEGETPPYWRPIAAEIMGSTWTQGRHTRGDGYRADCRKANWAVLHGLRLLRFTTEDCVDGTALEEVAQAFGRTLPARPRNPAPAARSRPSKQSGSSRLVRAAIVAHEALKATGLPPRVLEAAARAARGRAP